MDELSIPYEYQTIETSCGDTQVILAGSAARPPLVLLHGAPGCAPLALAAFRGLARDFRIYAIDLVGQPNLSAATRPAPRGVVYGQWMYELLSRLRVRRATLVGIGFGGFVAWKTLAFDARHIARAVLLAPAGIVRGTPGPISRRIIRPRQRYRRHRRSRDLDQYLAGLCTTPPDEVVRAYYAQALLHTAGGIPQVPLLSAEIARQITTPVSIIAAADDLLYPGTPLLDRARKLFPALDRSVLLPRARHVPGPRHYPLIENLIRG
jgi:pimeloyl-ACP methyl ester carboxylesterase